MLIKDIENIKLRGKWTNMIIINIFFSLESIGLIVLLIKSWQYDTNKSVVKNILLIYIIIFSSNSIYGFLFIKNQATRVKIFGVIVLICEIALLFLRKSMEQFILSSMPGSYVYCLYLWSLAEYYMTFAIILFVLDIILYISSVPVIIFYLRHLGKIQNKDKLKNE